MTNQAKVPGGQPAPAYLGDVADGVAWGLMAVFAGRFRRHDLHLDAGQGRAGRGRGLCRERSCFSPRRSASGWRLPQGLWWRGRLAQETMSHWRGSRATNRADLRDCLRSTFRGSRLVERSGAGNSAGSYRRNSGAGDGILEDHCPLDAAAGRRHGGQRDPPGTWSGPDRDDGDDHRRHHKRGPRSDPDIWSRPRTDWCGACQRRGADRDCSGRLSADSAQPRRPRSAKYQRAYRRSSSDSGVGLSGDPHPARNTDRAGVCYACDGDLWRRSGGRDGDRRANDTAGICGNLRAFRRGRADNRTKRGGGET